MTLPDLFADTGNLAVVFGIGGGVLVIAISTVAETWRKVRTGEQNAVLKQQMIEKGFTVADIERVMAAGPGRKGGCRKACGRKSEYSESA